MWNVAAGGQSMYWDWTTDSVANYSVITLRPAEETWVNQGKDGKTNTMKKEQAWNGLYTVAIIIIIIICRSNLTADSVNMC